MNKMVPWLTTTVGSAVGWWLGEKVGLMTAFILSIVGFAVGLYYGRKWLAENL